MRCDGVLACTGETPLGKPQGQPFDAQGKAAVPASARSFQGIVTKSLQVLLAGNDGSVRMEVL